MSKNTEPIVDQMVVAHEVIIDGKPLPIWVLNNNTILVFNPKNISESSLKYYSEDICNAVVGVS